MRRRIAWLCLLLGLALPGHADTSRQLVVHKKNGSRVSFVLSSYPEISFSNRTLHVTVGSNRTSFQIDDVAEYYFENDLSAISKPKTTDPCVRYVNEDIVIENYAPKYVRLYGLDGKEHETSIATTGNQTIISTAQLPHGVYIIKVDNQSFKIIRK